MPNLSEDENANMLEQNLIPFRISLALEKRLIN